MDQWTLLQTIKNKTKRVKKLSHKISINKASKQPINHNVPLLLSLLIKIRIYSQKPIQKKLLTLCSLSLFLLTTSRNPNFVTTKLSYLQTPQAQPDSRLADHVKCDEEDRIGCIRQTIPYIQQAKLIPQALRLRRAHQRAAESGARRNHEAGLHARHT